MGSGRGAAGFLSVAVALLLVALAGCRHDEGFASRYLPDTTPLGASNPQRLTLSPGEDQFPSWTPDGTGILYSFVDPVSGDRCLGRMPAAGGQVSATRCSFGDPANDSLDMAIEPMMRGDGQVAWVELHSAPELQIHHGGGLFVGPLDNRPARRVWHFPYLAQSGTVHLGATNLRWLSHDRLIYIGVDYLIRAICFGCKPDTVMIARDAMLLDVSRPDPVPVTIPGTAEATSLWPNGDSTGFFYTLAGDTRVWSRSIDGGLPSVVHDFGAAGIARDVSVAGLRLTAVVGGKVSYGFEESIGLRQIDSGGVLTMVDLGTGTEQVINSLLHRRGVIAPDGRSLVAERAIPPLMHPDMYLFQLP